MFHGLEGDSRSHYAQTLMAALRERGWQGVIPHFRGCSGELNIAPRFYHSGDSAEIRWVLQRCATRSTVQPDDRCWPWASRWAAMRCCAIWARKAAEPLPRRRVRLGAAGSGRRRRGAVQRLQHDLHAHVPADAQAQVAGEAGTVSRSVRSETMLGSRDLYAFDNVVTAPLHGFRDTDDYWARASSKPILGEIRIPRWSSTPATIRSCPPGICRAHARSAPTCCWNSPSTAATSAS
jgi:hypothetical protein